MGRGGLKKGDDSCGWRKGGRRWSGGLKYDEQERATNE